MPALFPAEGSLRISVLVEPLRFAVQNLIAHGILNSQSFKWRHSNDGTVHDGHCLRELRLVPQLVMHVNTAQEDIELRMRVYPPKSHQLVLQLHLEEAHFVLHDAHVLLSSLFWNQEMRDMILAVDFFACKKSQRFDFVLCISVGSPQESVDDILRTDDGLEVRVAWVLEL